MKWLRLCWYSHLFDFSYSGCPTFSFMEKLVVIRCRAKEHPNGPTWFNPGGFEPDMTCRDCGDEI